MSRRRLIGLAVAGGGAVLLSAPLAGARSVGAASPAAAAASGMSIVVVTAGKPSEHAFMISPKHVKRGTVVFKVTNLGKLRHSFEIHGHMTKPLRPHQSATLTVVLKKPARYAYSDTCLTNPNEQEMATPTPCAGGVLKVT